MRAAFEAQGARYLLPAYLLRFYVLLPDPLPLRDRYTYVRTQPMSPQRAAQLEADGKAFEVPGRQWLDNVSEQGAWNPFVDDEAQGSESSGFPETESMGAEDRHPGRHQFLSVVRIWNSTFGDSAPFDALRPVIDTQRRLREAMARQLMTPGECEPPDIDIPTHDYSVAEIVIPAVVNPAAAPKEVLLESLEYALDCVRHIQRSLYGTRRIPFRLATKETIPGVLFYEHAKLDVARADSPDYPVEEWIRGIERANISAVVTQRPAIMSEHEHEAFNQYMLDRLLLAPMYEYIELRRRATVALDRDGDYNTAIIWAGAAAEYLLDEVLRMMFWESGKTPEECVPQFTKLSIATRVKSDYGSIAGTSWNLKTPGPILNWWNNVAQVRNKVIHDVYEARRPQAEAAVHTTDLLLTHIGDLLHTKLSTHWRSLFILVGPAGLDRRGATADYEALRQAVWEPGWTRSFQNWRETNRRMLRDRWEKRVPDESRSHIIFVWGRRNRGYWILHDSVAHQAIRITIDEAQLIDLHLKFLYEALDGQQDPNDERAVSTHFEGPVIVRTHKPWREEHELMPMYGALVYGRDIKDREFTWRPTRPLPATDATIPARTTAAASAATFAAGGSPNSG